MPSTTTYQPGDLLLIGFPFSGGSGFKTRPAMVLLDSGDHDVVVARVTTQQHRAPYDVSLADWQAAGLLAASTVRLHKLATLEKTCSAANSASFSLPIVQALRPSSQQAVSAAITRSFGVRQVRRKQDATCWNSRSDLLLTTFCAAD